MMMMSQWRADGGRVEPESLSQLSQNSPITHSAGAFLRGREFCAGSGKAAWLPPDAAAAGRRAALCAWGCVVSFNACWTLRSSFCCRLSRPISREMPGMRAVKFFISSVRDLQPSVLLMSTPSSRCRSLHSPAFLSVLFPN